MTDYIHKLPGVKARTRLSRSTIYKLIKSGGFPAPVALGPRSVGWLDSTVAEWIASRPLASNLLSRNAMRKEGV